MEYPDAVSKVTRVVRQFTPISFTMFDWSFFVSFRRFMGVCSLIAFILMSECNAFFLKTVLWIPTEHWVNPVRVFFWWLMGIVSVREWWFFIQDSNARKLGSQAWLALAIGLTELFLVRSPPPCLPPMPLTPSPQHIKYGIAMDMYSRETILPSPPIVAFWVIVTSIFVGYTAWYFNFRKGAAEFRPFPRALSPVCTASDTSLSLSLSLSPPSVTPDTTQVVPWRSGPPSGPQLSVAS